MRLSRIFICAAGLAAVGFAAEPIRLHPSNSHYFLFRGRPAVLITGTEHYGAVLNLDFDYTKYLDELHSQGLNLTRTFTGTYREVAKNFNIAGNTLAPASGRFLSWRRHRTASTISSSGIQPTSRASRISLGQAGKRAIVVELSLFCPYYEDSMWEVAPFNAKNNRNGVGNLKRTEALTLDNGGLLAIQDAMVRKIVAELKELRQSLL